MNQKITMSTEIEALNQFFAAINRNDMQDIIKDFDPQIVRIEPEGFPTAGTYRGIAEVQEHIMKGRGTWAEGTCEPEGFFTNGDKVVVYLHVRVLLQNSTDWVDGRFRVSCWQDHPISLLWRTAGCPQVGRN